MNYQINCVFLVLFAADALSVLLERVPILIQRCYVKNATSANIARHGKFFRNPCTHSHSYNCECQRTSRAQNKVTQMIKVQNVKALFTFKRAFSEI